MTDVSFRHGRPFSRSPKQSLRSRCPSAGVPSRVENVSAPLSYIIRTSKCLLLDCHYPRHIGAVRFQRLVQRHGDVVGQPAESFGLHVRVVFDVRLHDCHVYAENGCNTRNTIFIKTNSLDDNVYGLTNWPLTWTVQYVFSRCAFTRKFDVLNVFSLLLVSFYVSIGFTEPTIS